jgi:hypothetical protein
MEALPGVVDENVNRAIGGDRLSDDPLDLSGHGDVGCDRERSWQLGGEGLETVRSPGSEHDSCS